MWWWANKHKSVLLCFIRARAWPWGLVSSFQLWGVIKQGRFTLIDVVGRFDGSFSPTADFYFFLRARSLLVTAGLAGDDSPPLWFEFQSGPPSSGVGWLFLGRSLAGVLSGVYPWWPCFSPLFVVIPGSIDSVFLSLIGILHQV